VDPKNGLEESAKKNLASLGYQILLFARAASSIVTALTALFLLISNVGHLKCFHSEQTYKNMQKSTDSILNHSSQTHGSYPHKILSKLEGKIRIILGSKNTIMRPMEIIFLLRSCSPSNRHISQVYASNTKRVTTCIKTYKGKCFSRHSAHFTRRNIVYTCRANISPQ
jgi:hypothetical protein